MLFPATWLIGVPCIFQRIRGSGFTEYLRFLCLGAPGDCFFAMVRPSCYSVAVTLKGDRVHASIQHPD